LGADWTRNALLSNAAFRSLRSLRACWTLKTLQSLGPWYTVRSNSPGFSPWPLGALRTDRARRALGTLRTGRANIALGPC